MKTNIKSLRNFSKKFAATLLKSNELIEVRGGTEPNTPPIIIPEAKCK